MPPPLTDPQTLAALRRANAYWAHIGRREAFARGREAIVVIGPVAAAADEIAALHRDFRRTR